MHSLIVPIQLFPTSQRDIPFQRVLRGGRIRGKTVELAIRWGEEKKKERKGSRPANCLSSFLFPLGGNRKKNIQRGKLKQGEGECFSLFLFLKETEDFPFFTTAEERLEELNLFVALMESVSIQGTKIIVIKNSDRRLCLRKKEGKVRERNAERRCEFPCSVTTQVFSYRRCFYSLKLSSRRYYLYRFIHYREIKMQCFDSPYPNPCSSSDLN